MKTVQNFPYVIVGAGFFGATVAQQLAEKGYPVLIIDKRPHLAGNAYSYTDPATGIEVHKYGSHIFHTELDEVWDYITQFTDFNDYIHTVDTRHRDELYPMPINLDTINLLYDANMDAAEAEQFVAAEAAKTGITDPQNFEEKALSMVGTKLYEAFLKGYTTKQWSTDPKHLSAAILSRIPVRFSHDNRYFASAKHQGIPVDGYTKVVERMLQHELIDLRLETDFKDIASQISPQATIVYCGQIDELLDYRLGVLPYRSLRFEQFVSDTSLGQAVINEADLDVPFTRTHDYKYYQVHQPAVIAQPSSILCREYPAPFERGGEAYYPINNPESEQLYQDYIALAHQLYPHLILGGRLGAYRYWDMDITIKNALELAYTL